MTLIALDLSELWYVSTLRLCSIRSRNSSKLVAIVVAVLLLLLLLLLGAQ